MLKMNNFCPINPQEDISHGNLKNGLVSALNRQDTCKRSATQRLSAAKVMVNLKDGGSPGAGGAQGYSRGGLAAVLPGGLVGPVCVGSKSCPSAGGTDAGHCCSSYRLHSSHPISFPGYRNLDTALTPELAGEGWVNDAMAPSSSVPPSTHNSGKAELGLTVPRAIPGNQNKCLNSCLVLLRPWLAQCKLLKKQFFFWKTPLPNTEFLKVNQKIQP